MSGAGLFARLGLENAVEGQRLMRSSLSCLLAGRHLCTSWAQPQLFSTSPPVCSSSSPGSLGGLSPLCRTPEQGHPSCGLIRLLSRVSVHPMQSSFCCRFPPKGASPELLLFSLSYPATRQSFLQPWLYGNSAGFQLVFQENHSTCRCIFDMFVKGDELHILLFCHLDPPHIFLFINEILYLHIDLMSLWASSFIFVEHCSNFFLLTYFF